MILSPSRKQWQKWLIIILSPLWSLLLVELLRIENVFDINIYGGWYFEEISCRREFLKQFDVVYAEYWHMPTLEAWVIFTGNFLILGAGLILISTWAEYSKYKKLFTMIVVFVTVAVYTKTSLIVPRQLPNYFFLQNALGLVLILSLLLLETYFKRFSRQRLFVSVSLIFGAYILGLFAGWWIYNGLFGLNLLPPMAYC